MRYNELGRTGLYVSEICLGTMTFGGSGGIWGAIGQLDQAGVDVLLAESIGAGVNFVDTADIYAEGRSEQLLGQSIRNLSIARKDIVIASKFYGATGTAPNDRGASRAHIIDAVAASLRRMQIEYIDLYQIHGFDPVTPFEETFRALEDLVQRGLVRYLGCSNWPAWQIMKALGVCERHDWARLHSMQAYYSLVGRDIEHEIVPMVRDQGMGLMIWSPLAAGLLSGKYGAGAAAEQAGRRAAWDFPPVDADRASRCIAAMRPLAEHMGVSVACIALAWLLSKSHVTSVIIGAKNVSQLKDNLAAANVKLTAEHLSALDAVSSVTPIYPSWMLDMWAARRRPAPFVRAVANK